MLKKQANGINLCFVLYGIELDGNKILSYNDNRLQNPLTYTYRTTFTWQNGRQMATASRNGKNLTFKYNDDGIRTEKVSVFETSTTVTNTTKFYLDGSTILAQETVSSTGTTTRFDFFYDDKGDVIGFKYNGANYFYIKNLQGDITDIVDSTGTVVVSYTYDTWGVVKSTTGTMKSTIGNKNPFRYRSYYYDTDLALYYLNSRYYDPDTGRFINTDSVVAGVGESIKGYNLYSYCFNNPVNMTDENGNWPLSFKVKALITKLTIKAVASVVKHVVDNLENTISKKNLTISKGYDFGVAAGPLRINDDFNISIDTKGNVGVQHGTSLGVGSSPMGISINSQTSVSNAPSIYNLEGTGYKMGVSGYTPLPEIPIPVGGGISFDAIPNIDKNELYYGATIATGIGTPGCDIYSNVGNTKNIFFH